MAGRIIYMIVSPAVPEMNVMSDAKPNLYRFLGVERTASTEELRTAFRQKSSELSGIPDNTPAASRHLHLLGLSYRMLNDPRRRQEYDATLPPDDEETPEPPAEAPPAQNTTSTITLENDWRPLRDDEEEVLPTQPIVEELNNGPAPTDPNALVAWVVWKEVAGTFLRRNDLPATIRDAVRILKPLTVNADNLMVLGYDPRFSNLIGYINTGEHFNMLRRLVREKSGRPLEIRFVETTNLEEWLTRYQAEKALLQRQTQRVQAKVRANDAYSFDGEGAESWNGVLEGMESWPALHPTPQPREQAYYIMQQVASIAHVEDIARNGNQPGNEIAAQINHALKRLGELTGIHPTVLALEYMRYRMR